MQNIVFFSKAHVKVIAFFALLSFFLFFFLFLEIWHNKNLLANFKFHPEKNLVAPLVDSPGKAVGSDFNGDGIHDMVMGAWGNNDIGADSRAVYILYGTGSFSSTYQLNGAGVNVTILGKAADANLGFKVDSAGDVNSDGFDDVLMGARFGDDGGDRSGSAYILYGSPNLSADYRIDGGGVDVTIVGKAANDNLGAVVSPAGDVNGDGFDDVTVGANTNGDIGLNSGAAYILYGSTSLSQTYLINGGGVNVTILGKAAGDQCGFSAGAGDVNIDGLDDLIIGALYNDDGGSNAGAAYILLGGRSLSSTIRLDGEGANVTLLGDLTLDGLGISTASAGDVNGDGFDDTITGAFLQGELTTGAAYLLYGRIFGSAQTFDTGSSGENIKLTGNAAGDQAGFDVSGAGDVNDDGFYDFMVSGTLNNDGPGGSDDGAAYLIYGGPSLVSITLGSNDLTILGKAALDNLSRAVASLGDVNNDGFPDFSTGAHLNNNGANVDAGAAYIVFGSSSLATEIRIDGSGPDVTIVGKATSDYLGYSIGGGRHKPGP